MRKFLKFCFFCVLLLLAGVYFGGGWVLTHYSRKFLPSLETAFRSGPVQLGGFDFGSAGFQGASAIGWKNVKFRARIKLGEPVGREKDFDFTIGKFSLSPVRWAATPLIIAIENMTIAPASREDGAISEAVAADFELVERLNINRLEMIVPINIDKVEENIGFADEMVRELLQEGTVPLEFDLEGEITAHTKGNERVIHLRSESQGGKYGVVLERKDLEALANDFDDKLTKTEIDIIAARPIQAPLFLGVRHRAETKAKQAHARDGSVPYDAYRYVLWSYLLTKTFNPTLAKTVTDAHEATTDTSPAETKMDINNAAVGRDWAKKGVKEDEILEKVKVDKAVIRNP